MGPWFVFHLEVGVASEKITCKRLLLRCYRNIFYVRLGCDLVDNIRTNLGFSSQHLCLSFAQLLMGCSVVNSSSSAGFSSAFHLADSNF